MPDNEDNSAPFEHELAASASDDLAELLRRSARELDLTADRDLRLRAALRDPWLAAVGRRRRTRTGVAILATLAAAAVLAAVVLAPALRPGAPASAVGVATAARVLGAVTLERRGPDGVERSALRPGSEVRVGDGLVSEPDGLAALTLAGGGSLRLDAGTRAVLASPTELALAAGAVYVDSGERGGRGSELAVRTEWGRVRHLGTQFEVRLTFESTRPSLRIRVREGEVGLEGGGASYRLAEGQELLLSADGEAALREIAIFGPDWSWVVRTAPLAAGDGSTLRAFLDAYAREAGISVRFAETSLAARADSIRVHGLPPDASPADVLTSVLEASELEGRERDGVLTISGAAR